MLVIEHCDVASVIQLIRQIAPFGPSRDIEWIVVVVAPLPRSYSWEQRYVFHGLEGICVFILVDQFDLPEARRHPEGDGMERKKKLGYLGFLVGAWVGRENSAKARKWHELVRITALGLEDVRLQENVVIECQADRRLRRGREHIFRQAPVLLAA